MEDIYSIVVEIDLRRLHEVFAQDIQGKKETRRCTTIPNESNGITEKGYVDRAGNQIRTSILRCRLWPVTAESRERYGTKQDWNIKLEFGKEAREALQQSNPKLAAQLQKDNPDYDSEIVKQVFPYIGVAYNQQRRELPPEQLPTTAAAMPADEDDDLPF